jgi:hypothetical protein
MKITMSNNFHNTSITLSIPEGGCILSESQMRKVDRLCGSRECTCGGIRGPQPGIPGDYSIVPVQEEVSRMRSDGSRRLISTLDISVYPDGVYR